MYKGESDYKYYVQAQERRHESGEKNSNRKIKAKPSPCSSQA